MLYKQSHIHSVTIKRTKDPFVPNVQYIAEAQVTLDERGNIPNLPASLIAGPPGGTFVVSYVYLAHCPLTIII